MDPSSEISHDLTDLSTVTSYGAGILQAQAYRTLRRLADESLQQDDLTSMQWFTIGAIRDVGDTGISISDLSSLLGTNVPYATNMVNDLTARNILIKVQNDADARSRLVTVDPGFLPRITAIEERVRQNLRQTIYTRITPRELALYVSILRKFSQS